MIQYHDLNPFNHGTTTIEYEEMPKSESSRLRAILKEGWGKDNANFLRLSAGAEKNSNNFRVETPPGVYLLKHSHVNNPEAQDLINKAIGYLKDEGIKTPTVIPTIERTTFYATKEGVFCFYNFVGGENFDGSRVELTEVASEIGRLHRALATIPYDNELKKINNSIVGHDRGLLEKIIKAVRTHGEQTDFDSYALGILDEINEQSQAIVEAKVCGLPSQIIHYDLHPHNVLFDPTTKKVASMLDFDSLRYSQRARDVGFGMHRFARTCGEKTERKNDVGIDIRDRARLFLNAYLLENRLTDKEIKALPLAIQDEALIRVMNVLRNHYLRNDTTWSFDLFKQATTLREGRFFSF
ncbi:MAG: phosphotransferase [Nanoarchaeota archaeon]